MRHQTYKLLFVDDDSAFLEIIKRVFEDLGKGSVEVHCVRNAGEAIATLQEIRFDLVVIDVRMPVVDGVQFLHLIRRKHPKMRKAILTGYADDTCRRACLNGGADLFMNKPRTVEEQATVFSSIRELLETRPSDGFCGVLRKVELHEVLQIECLSRHSAVICVVSEDVRGEIYIDTGAIVHAQAEGIIGYEAFYLLMAQNSGEFVIRPFQAPSEVSIQGSWEFLLMESAQKKDETQTQFLTRKKQFDESVAPPSSFVLPKVEARPPEAPILPAKPEPRKRLIENTRRRNRVVQPPVEEKAETQAKDRKRPRFNEIVVCDGEGGLVFEENSDDPDLRISFLEFLTFKGGQLAQGLNLGGLSSLEISGTAFLAMAHLGEGQSAFVLCSNNGVGFDQIRTAVSEDLGAKLSAKRA